MGAATKRAVVDPATGQRWESVSACAVALGVSRETLHRRRLVWIAAADCYHYRLLPPRPRGRPRGRKQPKPRPPTRAQPVQAPDGRRWPSIGVAARALATTWRRICRYATLVDGVLVLADDVYWSHQ